MTNPSPSENVRQSDPRPRGAAASDRSWTTARAPAPALGSRHFSAMRFVVGERQVTGRRAAAALGLSGATAGGTLRALERAGLLHGELVGGGELGYTATTDGRAWLEQRRPVRADHA